MICPYCKAQNVDGARFCGACGRPSVVTASDSNLPAAVDPMASLVGKEIAGRFRITAKLGEGGMGAVFRAEQLSLKRTVALKMLRPTMATSHALMRRFNAEAQAIAQLNHPNTVAIYDFGEHDGMLFIAMELIEGRSLRDVVHQEAPLPAARALMIAMQIAASLADAHAHGIIHRDLKPDNVMLQQRGKSADVARVLDFGIAKLRDDAQGQAMTRAGDIMGTPQYIAPEQAKGDPIDGRTDIYALGCMLYEMLTGRLPFEGTSVLALLAAHMTQQPVPPGQRRPELNIPPTLDALVLAAMAKEPSDRPATMDQLTEYMQQILATLPAPAWPAAQSGSASRPPAITPVAPSTYEPAPTLPVVSAPPPPKSRAPIAVVLGVLAVGMIGAGIYVATRSSKKSSSTPAPLTNDPDPGPVATVTRDATMPPDAVIDAPEVAFDPATQRPEIPAGARLISPGGGYVQTRDANSDKLLDRARKIDIALGPINDRGDIRALAAAVAKQQQLVVDHIGKVTSAGKPRDAAYFSGVRNGTAFKVMLIVYDGPNYRLAAFGVEPTAIWDEDAALQFFEQNVVVP